MFHGPQLMNDFCTLKKVKVSVVRFNIRSLLLGSNLKSSELLSSSNASSDENTALEYSNVSFENCCFEVTRATIIMK